MQFLMTLAQKRLFILTIIFLVGLGVFFLRDTVSGFFSQKPEQPFLTIQPEQITAVEIQGANETERIEKQNDLWFVVEDGKEFQADQGRVNTLIDAFRNIEKDTVASENPERHAALGIDTQKIAIKAGDTTHTLFVGNSTQISKNFVRIGEEDTVYVASGLNQVFSPIDYRDLTIPFVQNENEVKAVTITQAGIPIELIKQENEWFVGQEKANQSEVSFYLNELSVIRATNILDTNPVAEQGLFAESTITIKEGENAKTIEFYGKDETTKYAKLQNGETVYEITASLVDNLIKTREELVEEDGRTE